MKIKIILCSLMLVFFIIMASTAENIPEDKLSEIREYPESIVEQVNKHDVMKLIQDDYFVKTLSKELKNKKVSAEEKVYFFYLMLQKIQWAFCGGIGVPLPDNYAHNSLFQCITLNNYRNKLCRLGIDDSQFFDLTLKDIEKKPILAAYGFLLGSLVTKDIEKSFSLCKKIMYNKEIFKNQSWFRSMFIHNMMLMSPAFISIPFNEPGFEDAGLQDYSMFCMGIMNKYDFKEEEKEDLVIGIFFDDSVDNFGTCITKGIVNEKDSGKDCYILTSLILVQNRLNKDYFKQYIDMMIDEFGNSEEDSWKKNLIEKRVKENNYSVDYYKGLDVSTGIYTKSWDDISITAYDDGILFFDDEYAEFHPSNRK